MHQFSHKDMKEYINNKVIVMVMILEADQEHCKYKKSVYQND